MGRSWGWRMVCEGQVGSSQAVFESVFVISAFRDLIFSELSPRGHAESTFQLALVWQHLWPNGRFARSQALMAVPSVICVVSLSSGCEESGPHGCTLCHLCRIAVFGLRGVRPSWLYPRSLCVVSLPSWLLGVRPHGHTLNTLPFTR
jgi:hypothetical protein